MVAVNRNTLMQLKGAPARGFAFDRFYSIDQTSEDVYADCVSPLVEACFKARAADGGGCSSSMPAGSHMCRQALSGGRATPTPSRQPLRRRLMSLPPSLAMHHPGTRGHSRARSAAVLPAGSPFVGPGCAGFPRDRAGLRTDGQRQDPVNVGRSGLQRQSGGR